MTSLPTQFQNPELELQQSVIWQCHSNAFQTPEPGKSFEAIPEIHVPLHLQIHTISSLTLLSMPTLEILRCIIWVFPRRAASNYAHSRISILQIPNTDWSKVMSGKLRSNMFYGSWAISSDACSPMLPQKPWQSPTASSECKHQKQRQCQAHLYLPRHGNRICYNLCDVCCPAGATPKWPMGAPQTNTVHSHFAMHG